MQMYFNQRSILVFSNVAHIQYTQEIALNIDVHRSVLQKNCIQVKIFPVSKNVHSKFILNT